MEKDLGKIKKNDFTDVVLRIDDFGGRPGLTIREFVTGDRYTGFTKSGVKIPLSDFKKFKEMIDSVKEEDLGSLSSNEASSSSAGDTKKESSEKKQALDEGQETLEKFDDY